MMQSTERSHWVIVMTIVVGSWRSFVVVTTNNRKVLCNMRFRCPYCGVKEFSLITKLGINTKFGQAPRCHNCRRVSVRKFCFGGNLFYYIILGFSAALLLLMIVGFSKIGFSLGILLLVVFYMIFFFIFNYFFVILEKQIMNFQTMRLFVYN